MTDTQPTLVDFNTLCTVNIIGITEEELENTFQYAYPDQYTKILYEDGKAIVTCRCHWTAEYFYVDHKHRLDLAWHVEEGQMIDPATIPIYISNPVEEGYDEYEQEENEYEYAIDRNDPDLCQNCHLDYIYKFELCEHCNYMNKR